MAIAMGFESVHDLFEQADRLSSDPYERKPLSRWDWSRVLIATEIVFASDVIGSGAEWPDTTGLDDVRNFYVLRQLQSKLSGATVMVGPPVMGRRRA